MTRVREPYLDIADLMNQWFAPTKLAITFETEGQGKLTEEEIQYLVERDASGKVTALHLPPKSVIISNHQVGMSSWRECSLIQLWR